MLEKKISLTDYWLEIIVIILVTASWSVTNYTCFMWLVYFMSKGYLIDGTGNDIQGDDDIRTVVPYAWTINFVMNVMVAICLPLGGLFGDWIGSNYIKFNSLGYNWKEMLVTQEKGFQYGLIIALLIAIIVVIPGFALICTKSVEGAILGQTLFVIFVSMYGGNLPAFMVSLFDIKLRYSGVGISYNIAHAIFSSTVALIQTELVNSSHIKSNQQSTVSHLSIDLIHDGRLRPAYYIIVIAIISLLTLIFLVPYCRERREKINNLHLNPSAPKMEQVIPNAIHVQQIQDDYQNDRIIE